jgi:nitronate monooxygenase
MRGAHVPGREESFVLTGLLNIELPVVQAPMAGVQDSALAIAVSDAGGLGSLPCAMLDAAGVARELAAIRSATGRPVNLNFFAHRQPAFDAVCDAQWRRALRVYYDELSLDPDDIPAGPGRAAFNADMVEALRPFAPQVVSFHFGLPDEALLAPLRGWGAKIMATATTVAEARWLDARGADVIIAQGLEAGGHRGMFLSADVSTQLGLFALLPQVVRAVGVPVLAAGGIADAAGLAAARALGASGVQVGTAYLLCPEATTGALHRAALQDETRRHSALTNLFSGRPARGLMNRLMAECGPMSDQVPAFPLAAAAVAPLRARAESLGRDDFSPLWSGQNPAGCRAMPAAALTRLIAGRAD